MENPKDLLYRPEFPRSSQYEPDWVLENQMGPNALWLIEWLTEVLHLTRDMRVLDLGCGRGLTSIFLAKEFGVKVWAADLWITPENNSARAEAAGVADLVFPLRAEAHALPFAAGFFDAVVSVDAYHYFGTDVLYLGYLSRFLRPEGLLGIVVPGLMQEITEVPGHLSRQQANGKVFWEDECWSFKTADWWYEHWSRSGRVSDIRVDTLKEGWRHWAEFERLLEASGKSVFPSDTEALENDKGSHIGFVRAVAQSGGKAGENLYDPAVGMQAGVDN